jgi:prepilin-type N-terminal cleavage/methylation domain-containing protein
MRRRPGTKSEIRHSRFATAAGTGFTLLELVLVVAMIAVAAAVAIPRYGRAAGRYRADLAARRVAADLRQAQLHAKTSSASCTVAFATATSTYQILNAPSLDGVGGTYTVDLRVPPYQAKIVSASFGGPAQVTFSGWGLPGNAGSAVIAVGSEQRTIAVDGQTGQVSIQ